MGVNRRSLRELATTETELSAIAAAARAGVGERGGLRSAQARRANAW